MQSIMLFIWTCFFLAVQLFTVNFTNIVLILMFFDLSSPNFVMNCKIHVPIHCTNFSHFGAVSGLKMILFTFLIQNQPLLYKTRCTLVTIKIDTFMQHISKMEPFCTKEGLVLDYILLK